MKVVQDLVAYFDTRQRLTSRQLRSMLKESYVAAESPGNFPNFAEKIGVVYYFNVTGAVEGQVWGTDTYTRDSVLGAAAVHAGLLQPGQTDVLRLTVVPPLDSYEGTTRNGVTTSDYGVFPHAWRLSRI